MIQKLVKSPKFMWVVAGLLAYWFFGPSIPGMIYHVVASHPAHAAPPRPQPPKDDKPTPVVVTPPAVLQNPTDIALRKLLGAWEGAVALNEEPCRLTLELREGDKPGEYLGYSNLWCQPTMTQVVTRNGVSKVRPEDAMKRMNDALKPSATNLSGTAGNGAIKLAAQNTFGLTGFGCSIATLSVMPAGTQDLGADFTSNTAPGCEGGQLVMHRAR